MMYCGMEVRLVFFRFGIVLFVFKQKTAYELRISDWSSDVCSSDLDFEARRGREIKAHCDHLGIVEIAPVAKVAHEHVEPPRPEPAQHRKVDGMRRQPLEADLGEWPGRGGEKQRTAVARAPPMLHEPAIDRPVAQLVSSEEHTSELQSLLRSSNAVFCL